VVRRTAEVVGLIAVFLFASKLANGLEPHLAGVLDVSGRTAFFASWGVVLVAGFVGVRLAALSLSKLIQVSIVGWLDKVGGMALGIAFGAIVVSCLLVAALAAPIDDGLKDEIRDHEATGTLVHVAPAVYDVARNAWNGEPFFEMVREHVEPVARKAAEGLRGIVDELEVEDGAVEAEEDEAPK
jgi:hypothetical protein